MHNRYIKKFSEEYYDNSLDVIKNKDHISKFITFLKENKFPLDKKVHEWSKQQGYDNEITECIAYALLSLILGGGKSEGKEILDVQNNEIEKGIEIEKEHVLCKYDTDMVKYMQNIVATKITFDHLVEFSNYNSALLGLEAELSKSKK